MRPMHKQPEFSVFVQSTLAFFSFLFIITLIEGKIEPSPVYKVSITQQNSIGLLN